MTDSDIKSETYGKNTIGRGSRIFKDVTLGFPSRDNIGKTDFSGVTIGENCILRPGTIIYSDVTIGDNFSSGHGYFNFKPDEAARISGVKYPAIIDGRNVIEPDKWINEDFIYKSDIAIRTVIKS